MCGTIAVDTPSFCANFQVSSNISLTIRHIRVTQELHMPNFAILAKKFATCRVLTRKMTFGGHKWPLGLELGDHLPRSVKMVIQRLLLLKIVYLKV